MVWSVTFHDAFEPEFLALSPVVQDALLSAVRVLGDFGPSLGRPYADTLNGSRHANMKELRLKADGGVWRIAFAFDPSRRAILLVAGDKSGIAQALFYRRFINVADRRLDSHLLASFG